MNIEQQIFAVVTPSGAVNISPDQESLLVGKARWIAAISNAGLRAVPTVIITRAAWKALKSEKAAKENSLRDVWVKTLFCLVPKGKSPPLLAVRTSALTHNVGLMRARTDVKPPASVAQSVDTERALARAIDFAFDSYASTSPLWSGQLEPGARDRQIVIVQSMAKGELVEFYSRNLQTGEIGPVLASWRRRPRPHPGNALGIPGMR